MALVEIVLTQDVAKYGKKGDVVKVSSGFAQFLISQKKAKIATKSAKNEIQSKIKNKQKQKEELKTKFEKYLNSIDNKIKIKSKANESGHLFEGINSKKIKDILSEKSGVPSNYFDINMKEVIKSVGSHTADVLFFENKRTIIIDVEDADSN